MKGLHDVVAVWRGWRERRHLHCSAESWSFSADSARGSGAGVGDLAVPRLFPSLHPSSFPKIYFYKSRQDASGAGATPAGVKFTSTGYFKEKSWEGKNKERAHLKKQRVYHT